MGDVVAVEDIHHHKLDGNQPEDNNISEFVFSDCEIKKWTGNIYPK